MNDFIITNRDIIAFIIGVTWYNLDNYLTFDLTTKRLSKQCNYNCEECKCWHCQKKECEYLKNKNKNLTNKKI